MRIAAFRHVPFEGLGTIEPVLTGCGHEIDYYDCGEGGPGAPEDSNAYIFMGGPMSANDPLPYLETEVKLIRTAVQANKPVLGICLGAQLIAKALGARVFPNVTKEIGWGPVSWTPAAGNDTLFRGLNSPEMMFHWHGDTFDLPHSAEWLAWSQACRHQAFRVGDSVYGLQFHLEVTPAIITEWQQQDEMCGDLRELNAPLDPYAHSNRLQEIARQVFRRWADLITQ